MKRLGLARALDDPLCQAVRAAGWEPVPLFLTRLEATLAPPPAPHADAVILLSPAAARLASLPDGVPCLAQGAATARALGAGRTVWVSAAPRAEGLFDLLRERFPQGGTFLLARGERSREYLETAAQDTPWRVLPWITHREAAARPAPPWPDLDAFLALSPLQAELTGGAAPGTLRLAWGERTRNAYLQAGYPVDACCEPQVSSLQLLLASLPNP